MYTRTYTHKTPHPHSNIAEALISKGLGTCLRHRQDDDQRSSCYDDLLSAEARAIKNNKGVHSKKEAPIHRVADVSQVSQVEKDSLFVRYSDCQSVCMLALYEKCLPVKVSPKASTRVRTNRLTDCCNSRAHVRSVSKSTTGA